MFGIGRPTPFVRGFSFWVDQPIMCRLPAWAKLP